VQPSVQAATAQPGLGVGGGAQVVVTADSGQAAFALVRNNRVLRAWEVTSGNAIGEVQLATPFGDRLLVVVRIWTESKAEFVALVLGANGLEQSFAMTTGEWAESAPLGRFRLRGQMLYQLRSTPAGAEIVTYDLGGAQ